MDTYNFNQTASNTELPVLAIKDGHPVTTSLDVARVFGKQHKNVLQTIQRMDLPKEFTELNFQLSEYTDPTGRNLPYYNLTRDGFTFLVMGFTGKEATLWKIRYIEAFNAMEAELLKQKTQATTKAVAIALAKVAEQEREVSRIRQEQESLKIATQEMQKQIKQIAKNQTDTNDDVCYMTVREFCHQEKIFAPLFVAQQIGMLASDICRSLNIHIRRVTDERWNWVNSYPIEVLRECIIAYAQQRHYSLNKGGVL